MLLRPQIICLRIYRVINITKVTVLWIHISNGETQKYNFGMKTSWGRLRQKSNIKREHKDTVCKTESGMNRGKIMSNCELWYWQC